jgi:hypothetical protein
MDEGDRTRITLETRKREMPCLVCSENAVADCQDLARAFADHLDRPSEIKGAEGLLARVERVDEWIVCDHCQAALSRDDKVRLMGLWVVVEGLRNWLRSEMRFRVGGALPTPPPIQLA